MRSYEILIETDIGLAIRLAETQIKGGENSFKNMLKIARLKPGDLKAGASDAVNLYNLSTELQIAQEMGGFLGQLAQKVIHLIRSGVLGSSLALQTLGGGDGLAQHDPQDHRPTMTATVPSPARSTKSDTPILADPVDQYIGWVNPAKHVQDPSGISSGMGGGKPPADDDDPGAAVTPHISQVNADMYGFKNYMKRKGRF